MRCDPNHERKSTPTDMDKDDNPFCFPRNFTKVRGKSNLMNPGSVQSIHDNARNIKPEWIEGVQFFGKKLLGSANKSMHCSWLLSHAHPTGFRIGGSYQKQLNDDILATPSYQFDINPRTFATNFGLVYFPHPKVEIDMKIQADPWNIISNSYTLNYIGSNSTLSCTFHEPKPASGNLILSQLYKVNKNISLGGEIMVSWFHGLVGKQIALAAKYQQNRMALAATCSWNALDVTFWQKLNENVQIGSSLVMNRQKNHSIGSVFYQWEQNNVVIRGLIDSKWTVGFTYTKFFQNLSSSFGLSLYWCAPTNKFSCGFKFDLDDTFPKQILGYDH